MQTRSEETAPYFEPDDDRVINAALRILARRLKRPGELLGDPTTVKNFLKLKIASYEHEVFFVLYLDVKNRLISADEMFCGTLTHTSVYPREIVKAALKHNAASVMFAHNHPSGNALPSEADRTLTRTLAQALQLVDIKTLDHFVITLADVYSFAENGEL